MSLSKHLLTFSGQTAPIGALKGTVLVAPKSPLVDLRATPLLELPHSP
jgi:hypothetical protein